MKVRGVFLRLAIVSDLRERSRQPDEAGRVSIGARLMREVLRSQQASGSWHVLDNDRRIARHVASEVRSHRARIQIVAPSRTPTDNILQNLTEIAHVFTRDCRSLRA